VAEKAAAIDAVEARPLTWKTVAKRALPVAVAGAALSLVLPKLIAVLGAWPRLSTLIPAWFMVCLAAELASFICNFALQRLALRTKAWFPVVTAGLPGNSVTNSLPGAADLCAADHRGRRVGQPGARAYRPARDRRVRPVRSWACSCCALTGRWPPSGAPGRPCGTGSPAAACGARKCDSRCHVGS
jgi:hypothetical protein